MCHGVDLVTKQRQSADGWAAVVDDMVNRGAQGTDDEFEMVINYLSKNFAPLPGSESTKPAAGKKVDVNSANAQELTAELGLTKSDAEAIVQYRKDNGPFKDWD